MALEFTRALALSALVLLASGCKFALINVEGGYSQSLSTNRDCRGSDVCIFEITDDTFSETWTAIPDPLWEFVRWSDGTDFVCANSTIPTCTVSSVGTTGNALAESIIASDKTYYAMPIFQLIAAVPITDTVTLQGVEWAQPALFTNLTWDEIDAVCPGGVCNGNLNGFIMDGWTFANLNDVFPVFNFYIGVNALTPTQLTALAALGTLDAMWAAGWQQTYFSPSDGIVGRVRDVSGTEHYTLGGQEETSIPPFGLVDFFIALELPDAPGSAGTGAWFYRIP
ncbi:MAG: hypothetical protein HKN19_19470 [Halioglobus sp.]|nr:hypothetical protein [Halioglobus sp.]